MSRCTSCLWVVLIVESTLSCPVSILVRASSASDVTEVTSTVGSGTATVTEDLVLVGSTWQRTIGKLPAVTACTIVGRAYDAA